MAFDGEIQTESPDFESFQDAWDHSNDLGSKWYFYPFHFVMTGSGKTVADAPDKMEWCIGKRLTTIQRLFQETSILPEALNMECDSYTFLLLDRYGIVA